VGKTGLTKQVDSVKNFQKGLSTLFDSILLFSTCGYRTHHDILTDLVQRLGNLRQSQT